MLVFLTHHRQTIHCQVLLVLPPRYLWGIHSPLHLPAAVLSMVIACYSICLLQLLTKPTVLAQQTDLILSPKAQISSCRPVIPRLKSSLWLEPSVIWPTAVPSLCGLQSPAHSPFQPTGCPSVLPVSHIPSRYTAFALAALPSAF